MSTKRKPDDDVANRILGVVYAGGPVTLEDLGKGVLADRPRVIHAVSQLVGKGWARRTGNDVLVTDAGLRAHERGDRIKLADDAPPRRRRAAKPPRVTATARVWASLRVLRKGTADEVAAPANAGRHNAIQFFIALCKVGVMRKLPKAGSDASARYVLVRDLGPVAPVVRNDGTVLDRNAGVVLEPTSKGEGTADGQ